MNTVKELAEMLNGLSIEQTSEWIENIPDVIYQEYFQDKFTSVASNLDVDKHRHYELSTGVISILNGFMGVRSITDVFSEQSSIEDCYHTLEFFEMEEVMRPTYVKKL